MLKLPHLCHRSAHAHRLLCAALQATVFFPIEVRHAAQRVGWAVQAGE